MPFIETTKDFWKFVGENIFVKNIHDDDCERIAGDEDKDKRLTCLCVERFRADLPERYARAVKADILMEVLDSPDTEEIDFTGTDSKDRLQGEPDPAEPGDADES